MDFTQELKAIQDPELDKAFLRSFSIITGEILKYDLPSLRKLEDAINVIYLPGHNPMPSTLIIVGFFLGETMRRNLGGEWVVEAPDIWNLILKSPTKSNIIAYSKPILRASNFWDNRENTLTGLYKNIEFQVQYDITDKELMDKLRNEEGWITTSDGYMLHYTEMPTNDDEENKFLNKSLNK